MYSICKRGMISDKIRNKQYHAKQSFLLERRRHHLHPEPLILVVHHFETSRSLFLSGVLDPNRLAHHSRQRLPVDVHQLHVEVVCRAASLLTTMHLLDMIPHEISFHLVFRDVGLETDVTSS